MAAWSIDTAGLATASVGDRLEGGCESRAFESDSV
jgi:hypothetical protein